VLNSKDAMLIPKTKDGRVVFAIPFEGDLMLGTTENDYQNLSEEPQLEAEEIDFLLETLERYLQKPLDRSQVKSGFGGLRPLLSASANKDTKKLVRDHEIEEDQASGLISLMGGKWTTYRLMAKDTIDIAAQTLGIEAPCSTENHLLAGAVGYNPIDCQHISDKYALPDDVAKHLVAKYGSRAAQVADLTLGSPMLASRLAAKYSYIEAEVVYHCQQEMACKIRDVLARRTRLEVLDWQGATQVAPKVAELMAQQLGWNATQTQQELDQYLGFIASLIQRTKI
jgi:glycerol-3-phosphate dehydrogenase